MCFVFDFPFRRIFGPRFDPTSECGENPRDLHDVTVQNVVAIKADLDSVKAEADNLGQETTEMLKESVSLCDQVIQELRTLSYLLGAIYHQYRAKVVVLATPDEDETATRFEQALKCERIELPRHNAKDTVALLTQCDLFLSGNTNLFHFAAAFGVPAIGLFTERDERRWMPPVQPHVAVIEGKRGEKQSTAAFLEHVERLLSLPPRAL